MSYTPRSLFRILEDIDAGKILLPHIQRPFVWDNSQVERLLDSLMRDYPIQTFLFWRTKEEIRARRFMPIVNHETDLSALYDMARSAAGVEKTFVLDGQQRLQSLHSLFRRGMAGPGNNPLEAYVDSTAGAVAVEGDLLYRVSWEITAPGPPWFRIRDLTDRYGNGNPMEIADNLNDELSPVILDVDEARKARERRVRANIQQLSALLNTDKFFWVDELDGVAKAYPYRRILEIFVRVNSGGTKLSAGDLMFAAMKEGWEDVEQRVEQTTELLNHSGKLALENDFVLKALLLAHGKGAEVETEKFSGDAGKELLEAIEAEWDRSEAAFQELRDLIVHDLRLEADRLVRSYNALIPLFLHLRLKPKPKPEERQRMVAYFHKAQLFGWFRSQTDAILNALAGVVDRATTVAFPLEEIVQYFSGRGFNTELGENDLNNARLRPLLLNIAYARVSGASAFDVAFKGNEPHVDHIYPQYMLRSKLGVDSSAINDLGNLRFVGATDNIRKGAELPATYFARLKAGGVQIQRHLLAEPYASDPSHLVFTTAAFDEFRQARREHLFKILRSAIDLR